MSLSALLFVCASVGAPPPGPASISVKNASDGHLLHGTKMPLRGPHHRVLAVTARRGFHFGTDQLVGALRRAAARVAREYPGSVLLIGNMSRKEGGDIPISVSHNSGRDADLPFYAADKRGRSIREHGFIRFDGRGKSGRYRFDIRRNWAFVRAILSDKTVQVQWLFMSNPLRALLLDHARKTKEPDWLIEHASAVLGQPGNSSAHAEHFHVRLYCARHERLEGCLNYGTIHAWIDDYSKDAERLAGKLAARFSHGTSTEKQAVAAIEKVAAIRGQSAVVALGAALADARGPVRLAAARALRVLRAAPASDALVRAVAKSTDPHWTHELMLTLSAVRDVSVAPTLLSVLENRRTARPSTRVIAAVGLSRLLYQPAVVGLAAQLLDPSRKVRKAARGALRWLTNHDLGRGKRAVRRWRAWWARHGETPHTGWVEAGFRRKRLTFDRRGRARSIRKLVAMVARGGAGAWNARLMIKQLTGYWVERGHFSDRQMGRFYKSWLGRR